MKPIRLLRRALLVIGLVVVLPAIQARFQPRACATGRVRQRATGRHGLPAGARGFLCTAGSMMTL